MSTLTADTVKDLKKLARKIAACIDRNDHNEAVLLLAKLLEDKEAIETMEGLQKKQMQAGCMDYEWIQERYHLMKKLLVDVHAKYGTEVRDLFNGCF